MANSDLFDTFNGGSDVFYIDYKPIAPLTSRSAIEFLIPPSQVHYIDLKNSRLCVSVQLLDGKDQPLTKDSVYPLPHNKQDGSPFSDEEIAEHEKGRACPANLLLSSMFNQVDVTLNQNIVARTVGCNYPYKAMIDTLLYRGSYQLEKTLLASEFFLLKTLPLEISTVIYPYLLWRTVTQMGAFYTWKDVCIVMCLPMRKPSLQMLK